MVLSLSLWLHSHNSEEPPKKLFYVESLHWKLENVKTWNLLKLTLLRRTFCMHKNWLTINSLLSFSNSTDATDVLTPFVPVLFVPLPGIRFNGPRLSLRSSSNCLVSASTLATARLSSFSFSLNNARIESRSLPAIKWNVGELNLIWIWMSCDVGGYA